MGRGHYISPSNCIRILWQKMKCARFLGHKWILGFWCLEIIGFMDSFNSKKMYSYSSFFNVFVLGSPKIKSIRIRRDINICQISHLERDGTGDGNKEMILRKTKKAILLHWHLK